MKRRQSDLPRAIVVGSGAGGAAVARELQGSYGVTVLEEGRSFRPLSMSLAAMERLRAFGPHLLRAAIPFVFPPMRIRPTTGEMLLVNGVATGGSTVLSTGNGLRCDEPLRAIGVSLDREFEELSREVPVSTAHERRWSPATRKLFEACARIGLDPQAMPKMVDASRCRRCGRCVLGCPTGAKWDSRRFLDTALAGGARLVEGCSVRDLEIRDGRATAVRARIGARAVRFEADLVVLCAGGLGTPAILERSGIPCEQRLFVDPVLVVAAPLPASHQEHEMPMPFYVERPGYMVSPYFDYLSFLFDRRWRHPADGILALMIKLADSAEGRVVAGRRAVEKSLTGDDRLRLKEAEELCRRILLASGADERRLFFGTLNAGHPGGTVPLAPEDAQTLHPKRLPPNVYVADASLFPRSPGGPPILTIMALAGRVARLARAAQGQTRLPPCTAPQTRGARGRTGEGSIRVERNR